MDTSSQPTVLSAVDSLKDAWTPETKPVTRDERKYLNMLDTYIGPATGSAILLLCLFVFHFPFPLSEKVAEELALQPEEQEYINPALARLLDRAKFDESVKNKLLNGGDFIGLGIGLTLYGTRVIGTLTSLRNEMREIANGNIRATHAGATAGNNNHNGHGGIPAGVYAGLGSQYQP